MKFAILAAAILPAIAVAEVQVFPVPEGPYKIQWKDTELVDDQRTDPFNSTHLRRMMVSEFSPVAAEACKTTSEKTWMNSFVAGVEDQVLEAYLEGVVDWPAGTLEGFAIEVCSEVDEHALESRDVYHRFPTILLDPGINTTRLFYSGTAQQIATKGYNVIVMDHPYDTDVVEFPNGDIVFGGRVRGDGEQDLPILHLGIDTRVADASFALSHFGIQNSVYVGHSFGGPSALQSLQSDTRFASGVNLDGALYSDKVVQNGVIRPSLTWGSVGHDSTNDTTWSEFFQVQDDEHPGVWYKEISLDGVVHNALSDFSIIGDLTGLREDETLAQVLFGFITGEKIFAVMREYLTDFFEFTMLGGDEGLLAGESEEYPDMHFKRTYIQ